MAYLGNAPTSVPLSSADLQDGIITTAKIANGAVIGADINSTFDLTGKTVTLPAGTGGKVLQVVSTTKTDKFSISTTSTFTDITGFSVSITPASASNKILIIGHISGGGNICRVAFRLMRNSTAVGVGDLVGSRQQTTVGATAPQSNDHLNASFNFLDSPSSTSSITYKVQMIAENDSTINSSHGDANTNAPPMTRSISTITVMEIAA
jgi:hypothetical protein